MVRPASKRSGNKVSRTGFPEVDAAASASVISRVFTPAATKMGLELDEVVVLVWRRSWPLMIGKPTVLSRNDSATPVWESRMMTSVTVVVFIVSGPPMVRGVSSVRVMTVAEAGTTMAAPARLRRLAFLRLRMEFMMVWFPLIRATWV